MRLSRSCTPTAYILPSAVHRLASVIIDSRVGSMWRQVAELAALAGQAGILDGAGGSHRARATLQQRRDKATAAAIADHAALGKRQSKTSSYKGTTFTDPLLTVFLLACLTDGLLFDWQTTI